MQNARDSTLKLTTQRGQVQYEIKSILITYLNDFTRFFHEVYFVKSCTFKEFILDSILRLEFDFNTILAPLWTV